MKNEKICGILLIIVGLISPLFIDGVEVAIVLVLMGLGVLSTCIKSPRKRKRLWYNIFIVTNNNQIKEEIVWTQQKIMIRFMI